MEWPDIENMSEQQIKQELLDARKRFEVVERDLTKHMVESRKLKATI